MLASQFVIQKIFSHCCITATQCLCKTLHCPKKASVQLCIPIYCLPHIKQLVENFASKIANFNTLKKITEYQQTFLCIIEFELPICWTWFRKLILFFALVENTAQHNLRKKSILHPFLKRFRGPKLNMLIQCMSTTLHSPYETDFLLKQCSTLNFEYPFWPISLQLLWSFQLLIFCSETWNDYHYIIAGTNYTKTAPHSKVIKNIL